MPPQLQPLTQFIESVARMGDKKEIPDLSMWTSVMASCSSGQWQVALSLLEAMSQASLAPDAICFSYAISTLRSRWQHALHLALTAFDVPNVVCCNGVLSALSRGAQWEAALSMFRLWESRGLQGTCITFTTLVAAMAKATVPRWLEALELVEMMLEGQMEVDVVAWNTALDACGQARSWEHAISLLQDMPEVRLSPDIISFSSCVAACSGAAWQLSIALFSAAQRDVGLDSQLCVAALMSCCSGGAWQSALEVFRHQPSLQNTTSGIGALIKATLAYWPCAIQLLKDAERADLVTWNMVLSATPWEQGISLLSEMCRRQMPRDCASFGAVLRSCESIHEWEAALALLDDMTKFEVLPDLVACCSALSACEKGRQWQRCLCLLAERWQMPNVEEPDIVAYGAAVSACEKCGQWQAALQVLNDLYDRHLQLDQVAGNACLSALGRGAQWPAALRLFDEMAAAQMVDLISYNALMDQCPWHWALALAKDMMEVQVESDLITSASLCQHLDDHLSMTTSRFAQLEVCQQLEQQCMSLLERRERRLYAWP